MVLLGYYVFFFKLRTKGRCWEIYKCQVKIWISVIFCVWTVVSTELLRPEFCVSVVGWSWAWLSSLRVNGSLQFAVLESKNNSNKYIMHCGVACQTHLILGLSLWGRWSHLHFTDKNWGTENMVGLMCRPRWLARIQALTSAWYCVA